jgi:uncharacterized protein (TIGR01777 family)
MRDRSVLVTGATGLIGRRLVDDLLREGHAVRALSRSGSGARLPAAVEVQDWNGRTLPPEAVFRTRAVVHLSGEPVFGGRLTPERKRRIRDSRIESTRQIVEAMAALPEDDRPECFVCASAVGFYGSRADDLLDETQPPGEGFLAEVCTEWEQAASRAEQAGVRWVSTRFGIVLSRHGGALPNLLLPFRFGLGGRLGSGTQWVPWVHLDDAAGLCAAALRDERYRGPVNVTAPNPVTNTELTRTLGRLLSRPTLLSVPAFALKLALGELSGELLGSRRVVPAAARERDYEFTYTHLEDALRAEI